MHNHNNISDKKKRIIEKYNLSSIYYEKRYKKIQKEKYNIILRRVNITHRIILDAGCGSGLLFNLLIKKFKAVINAPFKYIGVDISLKMLKRFIEKREPWMNNLHLILADVEYLPLRSAIFDIIFSITSLQNLSNIYRGLTEMFKVGKVNSNFNISILKKNLEIETLLSFLNSKLVEINVIDVENIEDIIIDGKLKEL